MEALKCPQCGAPAQAAPGQWQTTCVYCKATFSVGAPPAPAYAPPPPQSIPQIVVIGPGARRPHGSGSAGLLAAIPGLIIAVVVTAVVWNATRSAGHPFGSKEWDGSTPLSCGGNDRVDAENVKASFSSSTVIVASGNCHVTCKACVLRGAVGVNASGNAHVTLTGGSLDAASLAVDAQHNAHVELLGTRVSGSVKKAHNASVIQ